MKIHIFPIVVILLCGCSNSHDKYDSASDQIKQNSSAKHRSLENNKERTVKMPNGGEITLKEGDKAQPGFVVTDDKKSDSKGVTTELKPAEPDKK